MAVVPPVQSPQVSSPAGEDRTHTDDVVEESFSHLSTSDPWINIELARHRIGRYLSPTLLLRGRPIPSTSLRVYYKCDHLRRTGAYKERGALNTLLKLSPEKAKKGVVAASAGNHAQALAYHGSKHGVPVAVFMPVGAPINKVENCRLLGAEVVVTGSSFQEAKNAAEKYAADNHMTYVNGYDHPDVISGAGTCGLEIISQLPQVDAVFVPVGGGGLIAGVALAIKRLNPNVLIIGAESERCPSMTKALEAGKPVYTAVNAGGTLADGLAVSTVGTNAFALVRRFVDRIVTVPESAIALAILHLLEKEKLLVEGAGCCGLAALMTGRFDEELKGKTVVTILCGGNIDMTVLGRVIGRGLYVSGRLIQFDCAISDKVGGLAHFMNTLANTGASVKDIIQEQPFIKDMGVVSVHVTIETTSFQHYEDVKKAMKNEGFLLKTYDDKKYDDVNLSKL